MIDYLGLIKSAAIMEKLENLQEAHQLAQQILETLRCAEEMGGLNSEALTEAIQKSAPNNVAALLQLVVLENYTLNARVANLVG